MKKKLKRMFEVQAALDQKIIKKADLDGCPSDYEYLMAITDEVGELIHELKGDWCWWKKSQEKPKRERVLEELVDIYHFVLSLTLKHLKEEDIDKFIKTIMFDIDNITAEEKEVTYLISLRFHLVLTIDCYRNFNSFDLYELEDLWSMVAAITDSLGFEFNDVYECYFKKNQANIERAENTYIKTSDVYFATESEARRAIDEIGEERLLKDYFQIKNKLN